jgi:hypothetical protein
MSEAHTLKSPSAIRVKNQLKTTSIVEKLDVVHQLENMTKLLTVITFDLFISASYVQFMMIVLIELQKVLC